MKRTLLVVFIGCLIISAGCRRWLIGNISEPYTVMVGSASIDTLVTQGDYDCCDLAINDANFKVATADTGYQNIQIVSFNKSLSTKAVIKVLEKNGMRPANIAELLALGIKNAQDAENVAYTIEKDVHVLALGSIWQNPNGRNYAPFYVCYLSRCFDERFMSLVEVEEDTKWSTQISFAAVKI